MKSGKILKVGLAASFALSLAVGNTPLLFASPSDKETKNVTADIYPTPQVMNYLSNEGMKFEGMVNVVMHGNQEEATLVKVKALLDSQGIAYQETDTVDTSKATIFISSDKSHCDDCNIEENNALNEAQGYVLSASNDTNPKGQVSIVGADEDGAYYGVMTLSQMMDQKDSAGNFAEVSINDYPSIKLRGYVEGFYGYPWSFEDRLGLMSDTSKYKMNTYIYAPKDDPYHKDQWRELYPNGKAEELKKLAQEAKKDNVDFCWSIHPGYGFDYNSDTDYNYLIAKFEQLYSLGVREFGISYDDLSGGYNGQQHANIINRVNQEFVKAKGDVKPLITVATRYCNGWGPSMNTYFKPFFSSLNDDVVVMWTGANTMSAITKEAFEWPKTQTGVDKDLAAWWNYPVNDYCDGNLMMSPLENLDNDVDNLSGFFLNPMSQAEASKVAIFSGADYSWNVSAFEKTSSWKRATSELVPDATAAFQRFADNISYIKDGFEFDESRYLVDKLAALSTALQSGQGISEAATALKIEFETMKDDVVALKNISNRELLEEINIFLDAYNDLAKAGIASMDAFVEAKNGNIQATLSNIETLKEKLAKVETYTIDSLESNAVKQNVVKVGVKRIKPMLNDSVNQIQDLLMSTIDTNVESKVISSDTSVVGKEITFAGGNFVVNDLKVKLGTDGYVGYNLPNAMKLAEIRVTTPQANDLAIQYSLNGITWTNADSVVEDGIIKSTTPIAGAYVRVINNGTKDIDVTISEFKVNIVYNIGAISAATDLGTYGNNTISRAVDGNIKTQFYSSAGATVGSYVRVDLGKAIPLHDLKICYAVNPKGIQEGLDGFAATKLEVSTDAATWHQIGDVIEDDNYVVETIDGQQVASVSYNAEGQMARYIRFMATEASDNWVQVFEVLYNKTVSNIGDDSVDLIETNFNINNATNLYDGDLTTALSADSIKDGDYLTYKMTNITNVGDLVVIQDAANKCGAKVSVKDLGGKWSDVGYLNDQVNTFCVNNTITEVKLSFDASKPLPVISEMLVKAKVAAVVNKTALTIAVEEAMKITDQELDQVVPAVVKEFKAALKEANEILKDSNTTQEIVNNSFDRLSNAMQMLSFIKGDKTQLQNIVDKINTLNANDYLSNSWALLEPALTNARNVLANENAMEEEVSGAHEDLIKAFLQLRLKPNKDLLNELIQKAEGLSKEKYTAASWNKLEKALTNAKAVFANAEATQEEVTAIQASLTKALDELKVKEAATVIPIKPGQTTSQTNNSSKVNAVKTGDSTSFIGIIGLGTSLATLVQLRKKKEAK